MPIPEPMMSCCQRDPQETNLSLFLLNKKRSFNKMHLKMCAKCHLFKHLCSRLVHVCLSFFTDFFFLIYGWTNLWNVREQLFCMLSYLYSTHTTIILNIALLKHSSLVSVVIVENINTLRPRQNGRHSTGDIFKCISLNESIWIPIKISLKFVLKSPINNIAALVQIMAWRWPGNKPLYEPVMVILLTHICITQPQWVNV